MPNIKKNQLRKINFDVYYSIIYSQARIYKTNLDHEFQYSLMNFEFYCKYFVIGGKIVVRMRSFRTSARMSVYWKDFHDKSHFKLYRTDKTGLYHTSVIFHTWSHTIRKHKPHYHVIFHHWWRHRLSFSMQASNRYWNVFLVHQTRLVLLAAQCDQ